MTESYSDLGVQQPFQSGPSQPAAGGCGKPALIGCGILIILFGIASIFFMVKARDMFAWIVTKMEVEVVRLLPEEVGAAERNRLTQAFGAAKDSILEGELDPLDLQDLQQQLARVTSIREGKMTREDVRKLTLALERVGGIRSKEATEPEVSPPTGLIQGSSRSISVGLQMNSSARYSVYCVATPASFVRPLFAPGCVAPPLSTPSIASSVRLARNEYDLEGMPPDLRRTTPA